LNSTESINPISLVNSYGSAGGLIKQNMYNHLNSIWTQQRISVVFGIILEIFNTSSSELLVSLLNSLSQYMNSIDLITANLISSL
jgi:hypothetical protein